MASVLIFKFQMVLVLSWSFGLGRGLGFVLVLVFLGLDNRLGLDLPRSWSCSVFWSKSSSVLTIKCSRSWSRSSSCLGLLVLVLGGGSPEGREGQREKVQVRWKRERREEEEGWS